MSMMLRLRRFAVGPVIALALAATDVHATAQRTFVASTGLDTNACSLMQPCRSFNAALAQANVGGEVIVLDSAGYGEFTVTKSVTITAPVGVYAGISVPAATNGVTVDAPGAIVVLRGLTIVGLSVSVTDGIHFSQGAELHVERCEMRALLNGIYADLTGGAMLYIKDSTVTSNFQGVWLHGNGHASFDHVRLSFNFEFSIYLDNMSDAALSNIEVDNSEDILVSSDANSTTVAISRSRMASSCGEGLFITATNVAISAIATDTQFAGDNRGCSGGAVGVEDFGGGTARVWLVRDTFTGNQGAVYTVGPGAVAYLDGSLFISNPSTSFGIDAAGGPIYTRQNNTIRGTTISPNFLPYSAQ